jgi:DNA-binding NarL/FixJ family response regulator
MIRVMIADDHREFRLALRLFLRSSGNIELVGEASNGRDAVRCVRHLQPDVLVMDISMPKMNGLAATREIVALAVETRIILITSYRDALIRQEVMAAGAHGYVPKELLLEQLLLAIETVHQGGQFFLE